LAVTDKVAGVAKLDAETESQFGPTLLVWLEAAKLRGSLGMVLVTVTVGRLICDPTAPLPEIVPGDTSKVSGPWTMVPAAWLIVKVAVFGTEVVRVVLRAAPVLAWTV
jgi:hypothetical protein